MRSIKLTKKQKGFVDIVVATDNATEAVVQNYNVKDRIVAKSMGSENLAKPYILEAVEKERKTIADRLPDDLLAERHLELLNKREMVGDIDIGPDTQAVSKGLDMAYKIKDTYAPEKKINANIDLQMMGDEELQKLAQILNGIHQRTNISGT